jgi:hypothetical protein
VRAADRTDASRLLAAARGLGRDSIQAGEILLVEDTHGKGHLSDHIENKIRHSLFFPIESLDRSLLGASRRSNLDDRRPPHEIASPRSQ